MKKATTVSEYIAAAPPQARAKLRQLRAIIKATAPKSKEGISYAMPYYGYLGRFLYFAGFKSHIGMYPFTSTLTGDKQVAKYKTSSATVQFVLDKPLPVALIKRLIKAKMKEQEDAAKKKALKAKK